MKTPKWSDVKRNMMQKDFFPDRSTVGREIEVEMIAVPCIPTHSTEIGNRPKAEKGGRQPRLSF